METFCTPEPGPELVTACSATADPSTHSRRTPPGRSFGHLGQEKTLGYLKDHFYWPDHFCDIHKWCGSCISCSARKTPAPG